MKIDFSLIRNFYEVLVFERVAKGIVEHPELNLPAMALDVACIALNRLPPKYILHDADMFFYMTAKDRQETDAALDEAVQAAFDFVVRRERDRRQAGEA